MTQKIEITKKSLLIKNKTMKEKIQIKGTKKLFEQKIIAAYGHENLGARMLREEGVTLTLYYDNRMDSLKAHVGTWQKGGGWMYATKS